MQSSPGTALITTSCFSPTRLTTFSSSSPLPRSTLPTSSRLLLAPALSALATAYAARESTRHFLYRAGLFSAVSLPAPVISIGNLTSASGKTPFVEYLARHYLQHHGLPSLIIQLGGGTVDETIMLRHSFDATPVTVTDTSSTTEAKEILRDNPALKLVLLDNGLQHLPLQRDLDVVTINALAPLGNGHLRPRGTLRELARPALKRSDLVVLHHVDLAGKDRVSAANSLIGGMLPRHAVKTQTQMTPVWLRCLVPSQRSLDMSESPGLGEQVGLSRLDGAAVVCLTGVGSPATVEEHLKRLGARLVEGCGAHEDHHEFSLEEAEEAVARVRQLARDPAYTHACILLTEKDYARQFDLWASVFSQVAGELEGVDGAEGGGSAAPDGGRRWGAYVLHSELQVVEHDRRFSTQSAVLAALLRISIDNFRRRSYMS